MLDDLSSKTLWEEMEEVQVKKEEREDLGGEDTPRR